MSENAWTSKDGNGVIFHEPIHNTIVIDTYNHNDSAAILSPEEAREAAAALLAYAEIAERVSNGQEQDASPGKASEDK